MAAFQPITGRGEQSFRHDPRMRQALARLPRPDHDLSQAGPACTSLYWLLRSRRPRLAALSGRPTQADQLIIACALADCGARLVIDPSHAAEARADLSAAGLDWILRSGACLPCLRQLGAYDCLILAPGHDGLERWLVQLAPDAMRLGLCRTAAERRSLSQRMLAADLAEELAELRDGSRQLLIADGGAR